jgi:excisionase family DNA binding protein
MINDPEISRWKISPWKRPDFMTAEEVARYLGISLDFVYTLAKKGELWAVQISKRWRFRSNIIQTVTLQEEEPELHVPHVTLHIANQALEMLLRDQLGQEGMGVILNPPEPDTIITDGQIPTDPGFSGRTISIVLNNNGGTLGRHLREGEPVTLTTMQFIFTPKVLRQLLGIAS